MGRARPLRVARLNLVPGISRLSLVRGIARLKLGARLNLAPGPSVQEAMWSSTAAFFMIVVD